MKTAIRIAALSVPIFLTSLAPSAFGQGAREPKAERLEQLRAVLAHENSAIATLESLKSNTAGPHTEEMESAIKGRDAVQRLINQIDGAADDAGIAAAHKRDENRGKNVSAPDYYTAIKQVRQEFEDSYGILNKDPGKQNPHLKTAMKEISAAREPVVKEVTAYESAHPAVVATAPPALLPLQSASVAPGAVTPAAPAAAASTPPTAPLSANDPRINELKNAISHLDHAIDDVTAQPATDPLRQQTLAALVKARDDVRKDSDTLTNTDLSKDLQADHARDASTHTGKLPDYYSGLIQAEEYLQNDHVVLGRQPDDANHLHATAVKSIEDAYGLIRQQIDAYHKAHPNTK